MTVVFAGVARPQTVSGTISGAVKDQTDAVVVGATITLINEATGAERSAATNEVGLFGFQSVQPGSYTVQVAHPGFKAYQQTGLALTANERLPVEVRLELGATAETVRVEAHGATVQTASAERSGTVTARQLSTLQLKGRDFMGLLRLLPGVVDMRADSRESPGNNSLSGISIQGGRQGTYNLTLDGITNLDTGSNTGPYFEPSMDAIAEVKVLTTNYQAEYGRNSGAAINVIMRSGTRDFHGSGYYYKRNEALNANSFFNNVNDRPRERYRYDLGGWTVGGPLTVGSFNRNRDKLFFFLSQEIQPQRRPLTLQFRSVPSELERRGDYRQTFESDGRLKLITDPAAGAPFPNNVIPASRINPNGQAFLNIFPQPNTSSPTNQFNYLFQGEVDNPRHVHMLRLDYQVTPTTSIFWRGIGSFEKFRGAQGFVGVSSNWPQIPILYDLKGRGFVFNLTKVISSRTVNEFTWGVNRGIQDRTYLDEQALASNQRSKVGMETLGQFYPRNNPEDIIPDASFGGVPNAVNLLLDPKFPFLGRNNLWNYTNNLSHNRGSHTLKLGIYFEPTSRNTRRESLFRGSYDFGRDVNNPLDTNWAWSNTLIGSFRSYRESDQLTFAYGRVTNLEWYVQDNWRATRRLTLDFGLRFYWIAPNYSAPNNLAGFVPDRYDAGRAPLLYRPAIVGGRRVAQNPATGEALPQVLVGAFVPGTGDVFNGMVVASQDSSYPRGLIDNRGIHYAPRFGFAYDLFGNGKTAVRGGFGMFYDRVQTDQALVMTENPPLRNTPILFYNTLDSYLTAQGSVFPTSVFGLSRSGEVPTVMNWSFGVQQNLGYSTVLDMAYVGSVARHLMVNRDINLTPYGSNFQPANQDPTTPGRPLPVNFFRPFPGYDSIGYREFSGTSNYHSLQVGVNRRFARSLQYGVSWTWSKAMDYADGNFTTIATHAPLRAWNYGKAGFDRTHNLVISYTWDLPKVSPRWNNSFSRWVLDNWMLSGINSFISGAPLGIGFATTDNADIAGGGDGVRTVVLQNPVLPKSERTFDRFFNTNAFGRPAPGTFGNAPKDVIRGPGSNNWDISVFKNIPLGNESRLLQLRVELYNAFNHAQFSAVDTAARFDPAGRQTNLRFGQITAANPPRQIQLSARVTF
ncbi:MAG: TonB-dependent receptor [Bryobacteraceae bacterium]